MRRWALALGVGVVGCGPGDGDDTGTLDEIPEDTLPCESPEYWPETLASEEHPLLVHFRPGEQGMAETVLGYLDTAWTTEVDTYGFRPPLADPGVCGPDASFDVFLWDGLVEAYVDAVEENPETAWDDWFTYMAVDAWGPYGGDILDGTLAHEFNHACQASDDWWDSPIIFEMTSVFAEDLVFDDDDDYETLLVEFQARPDWSIDRNDDYETWYMYGAVLYLRYVRDRFFDGDGSFASEMWLGMRNPAGENEPDFEDSLDALLEEADGVSYLESVVEFARWRWYVADNDDGQHFEEAAEWPVDAKVAVSGSVGAAALPEDVPIEVMALGSAYVDVTGGPMQVSLVDLDPAVTWVVQALPGVASDGDVLDLGSGPVTVDATTPRTLVVTALPLPADADPDDRTDTTYAATLHLATP